LDTDQAVWNEEEPREEPLWGRLLTRFKTCPARFGVSVWRWLALNGDAGGGGISASHDDNKTVSSEAAL